jgi:hypothetical protein
MQTSFAELFGQDGLTVFGRGLGIELLFTKFVQYFSLSGPALSVQPTASSRVHKLVFCINAQGVEQAVIDLLLSEGASPDQLPKVSTCRLIDSLTIALILQLFFSRLSTMKLMLKND